VLYLTVRKDERMSKKIGWGCIAAIISIAYGGISFYLNYRVFMIIGVDSLMWFLFWASIPMFITIQTIANVIQKIYSEED
jgi:hypothetical protein